MNNQKMQQMINQHNKATSESRRLRNLADSLYTIAHIQDGSQLVALLGKGDERDNREAIRAWVKKELHKLNLEGIDPLDYLYARLLSILADRMN